MGGAGKYRYKGVNTSFYKDFPDDRDPFCSSPHIALLRAVVCMILQINFTETMFGVGGGII